MKARWQSLCNGHWLQIWELRQRRAEAAGQWGPITLLLCGMALLLGVQNPLLYGMAPGFDASLFAAMGRMWATGDVLYRDMLDIKGPVIFLLDAFGYKLGGFPGIALFETALLAWGLNNSYRALALLGIAPLARLAALLGVISLCGYRYYYGNMTEDYTLCLALIAQLPFVRLLTTGRFSWSQAWLPALTFGLIAMMRLNNGAFWGAWYAVLFLGWCGQGRWLDGVKLFVSALAGVAVIAAPLVLYFWQQGVLENFWFYSFAIFMGQSYGTGFSPLVGSVGLFRTGLILLLPLALFVLHRWHHADPQQEPVVGKSLVAVMLFGALFGVIANSVSGHIFDHYDQLYLAFIPLPLALIVEAVRREWGSDSPLVWLGVVGLWGWIIYLIMPHWFFSWSRFEWPMLQVVQVLATSLFLALILSLPIWLRVRSAEGRSQLTGMASLALLLGPLVLACYSGWVGTHTGRPFGDSGRQQIAQIRAETSPDERIWIDGTMPQFYVWTDRKAASAYLFFDNVHPPFDVKARVLADIRRVQPKFIVIRKKRLEQYAAEGASFPASQRAFYAYVFAHYQQVQPGLFKLSKAS
jgi:hypothetical protein